MRAGLLAWALVLALGCPGGDVPPGEVEGAARPPEALAAAAEAQEAARDALARAAGAPRAAAAKRILFGDLHAHTTWSLDAFAWSLPLAGGEGAHPPADACDFARHCSRLDFFALTDHAESLTPGHWAAEKEMIRQCNARAGDPADPDLVAFTGFEWTQAGATPETHWGHRCVIFRGTGEDALPARPISSRALGAPDADVERAREVKVGRFVDPASWDDYANIAWLAEQVEGMPVCPQGVDVRELPPGCSERAPTPDVLLEKLDQWGHDVMLIPHGTTWGAYTPPGARLDKQLDRAYYDPARQPVIEIMSGHGNSEEHRPWRAVARGEDGAPVCPEPTPGFLPCCWRAGELVRERCGDLPDAECRARVEEARRLALEAGVASHLVVPDAAAEDWLDCDQCRDCFKPSYAYRPGGSVQYGLALTNPEARDDRGRPLRFRYGFIASSDNHSARPGTGYKQVDRHGMTDTVGPAKSYVDYLARGDRSMEDPRRPQPVPPERRGAVEVERLASFWYPGGLVAVHAEGRGRDAIWEALARREVYGTSGPRILLWFDLVNDPGAPRPMGSGVALAEAPRFEVRAVGAFEQRPGCPDASLQALSDERLERVCRGECHHPGEARHPIVAIEVVRIRPQAHAGEPVADLVEDPWRRIACPADPAGCVVRFSDPDFAAGGRDALYYVRALQAETPAINGATLRTGYDAEGEVVAVRPCSGSYRTPREDDCLAPVRERAWSSPIFVDHAGSRARGTPADYIAGTE